MAVTSSSSSSSSLKLPSLSPLLTSKTLTWLPQLLPHWQQRPYLSLVMTSPSPQQIFRTHASKSSSTSFLAFDQIKEDVPTGVEVTETKEPGSRVPGFRPGKKIPDNILINYLGKQNVLRATIEAILKRTLPHVMSSVEGRALKDSVRIKTKFSDLEEDFSPSEYLRYEVVVDMAPEVKWISEDAYKHLKVVVEIDQEVIAEKASETELSRRYKAIGPMRIVNDRGLQLGDVIVLDIYANMVKEDESTGESIPSAESKGFHLDTEGADNLLPGFLDSIMGIGIGETKPFRLVFPESWKQENLRGICVQFTVECKELFYRDLPVLDDSLASKLISGCSTLSEVRQSILQTCKEVEQTAIERATDNALLDALTKIVAVEIPQSIFEEQGRQLYGARLLQLQANMKLSEQQLASLSSEKAVNEYLDSQKENITNLVKQMLAVGEIYKRENLQYSLEELEKEVQNSVAEFKSHDQEYDEKRVREQVQDILEGAKVLEWLREHADIQYVTR
ncbi:hypothetical protein AMTRI_Chr10g4170 [Amborella trichopoda]